MKLIIRHTIVAGLFILGFCVRTNAQNSLCSGAQQLCFGTSFSVPSNTVNTPEPYNYSCVTATQNITWGYVEVAQTSGTLSFNVVSGGGNLDYVAFGPFNDLNSACSGSGIGTGSVIACEYGATTSINVTSTSVTVGDVYVVAIFNPSGNTTNFYLDPVFGTNDSYIDCDDLDANVTDTTAEFCTGSSDGGFIVNPQGGQAGPYDVFMNTTNITSNDTITGLTNGTYIVGVSDYYYNINLDSDTVLVELLNTNCSCQATVGQVDVDFEGVSSDSVKMCIDDLYHIEKVWGQVMPPNETGGPNSYYDSIPYDPAVLMLVYSAPPNTSIPAQNDPNYEFWLPQSVNQNFIFENDAVFNQVVSGYGIPNNEFYVVPATVYYHEGNGNFITCIMHQNCFEYGTVYKVQLLKEIQTTVVSEDCANDSMYLEVNGGYPEFYNTSPYDITNINPATIAIPNSVFENTPFQVSNFGGFTNYSFIVTDSVGCADTVATKYGFPNYQLNYGDTVFCLSDSVAQANISNLPSGVSQNFSSPNLVVNANGDIDIAASGTQASASVIVNLYRPITGCEFDDTLSITIQANPEIDTLADESLCSGEVFEPNFTSPSQNVSFGIFTTTTGFGIPATDSGLTFSYFTENTGANTITLPVNYYSFDDNCSSDTLTMELTLFYSPAIVDSLIICPGESMDIEIDNVNSIEWFPEGQFSDPTSTITNYTAGLEDEIYVNTTTDNCSFEDTIRITRSQGDDCIPEPYSAFSPNGDGQNDTWIIPGIENYPENEVTIYNRWGDVINDFENYNNFEVSWDGTNNGEELPTGTYFYTIEFSNELKSQGWVKLLK